MLDCPIAQYAQIQAAKERFPLAERNRSKGEMDLVHVAGLNVLLHGLDPAANLDVFCACRFARPVQRNLNAVSNEMKSRSAQHFERRARIMGQYESRRMIRRI